MIRLIHPGIGLLVILVTSVPTHSQSFLGKTEASGMGAARNMNAVAVADYDLDGDLDVYLVNFSQHDEADPTTWNHLYRNNGDGTFTDVTAAAGVSAESVQGYDVRSMGIRLGAAWGDYDNDGDPDLLLTHVGPEILYRNNGDGTFTDVTATAGVAGDPGDETESSSAVWWDYDNDGDLDLYISAWDSGPNRMYENDGAGVFTDVSVMAGLEEVGSTWTSVPIDVNEDGLMDLYTVNDFGQNKMFVNNGDKTFTDETEARGLGDRGHGMGVTVGDFNNDGHFDIYLTNIYVEGVEWNPLYTNDGTGRFDNLSRALGVDNADWAWGTEFFDCDHDGDLDLYVANGYFTQPKFPNRMFVNQLVETGSPSFENQASSAGVAGTAQARGIVAFDYDDDGDLDLLIANPPTPWAGPTESVAPYFYENVSTTQNWVKIDLRGTLSNLNGVGARVRVDAGGKSYFRQNDGVGYLGQSIRPIHVGLGAAETIDVIEVKWPSGLSEAFTEIAANQLVSLEEGRGVATAAESDPMPGSEAGFRVAAAYPNPFTTHVTFDVSADERRDVRLIVSNVLGQVVATRQLRPAEGASGRLVRLNLSDLPAGIYFYATPGQPPRPIVKVR